MRLYIFLPDSIKHNVNGEKLHDSNTSIAVKNNDSVNTTTQVEVLMAKKSTKSIDSIHSKIEKEIKEKNISNVFQTTSDLINQDIANTGLIQTKEIEHFQNFNNSDSRFSIPGSGNSIISYKPEEYWTGKLSDNASTGVIKYIPHIYQRSEFNWTLIVGFISVLLLMVLTTYYKKFVNQVIITLVNFQLAEKMLREKNIIVRRAFFIMNINFVLMFSMFLLLIANYLNIRLTQSYYIDYIVILAITITVLLARLFILKITGTIFETSQAFNEQIHNNYLINKNLGLIMLPLVFTAIYSAPLISKILLLAGTILLSLATMYKIIRGFQIILRNGVLLFYAILYLCTLELLPLAIGSKILISLR